MGKHDGSRKRKAWKRVKSHKIVPPYQEQLVDEAGLAAIEPVDLQNTTDELLARVDALDLASIEPACVGQLREVAPLIWSSDWSYLVATEHKQLEDRYGLISSAETHKGLAPLSTYRQRGLERRPAKSAERAEVQAGRMASAALRQHNQQKHTFEIVARSIAALSRRLPYKEWCKEMVDRRLLSRATSVEALKQATAAPPSCRGCSRSSPSSPARPARSRGAGSSCSAPCQSAPLPPARR